MPAGSFMRGSGAMSQSKAVIVRNVGVERREDSSIPMRPFWKRASSSSASRSASLGTTPYSRESLKNSEAAPSASVPVHVALGELLGGIDHVAPTPVVRRLGDVGLPEEVAVVVDDEARDVLR